MKQSKVLQFIFAIVFTVVAAAFIAVATFCNENTETVTSEIQNASVETTTIDAEQLTEEIYTDYDQKEKGKEILEEAHSLYMKTVVSVLFGALAMSLFIINLRSSDETTHSKTPNSDRMNNYIADDYDLEDEVDMNDLEKLLDEISKKHQK